MAWPAPTTVSLAGLFAGGQPMVEGECTVQLGDYTDEILMPPSWTRPLRVPETSRRRPRPSPTATSCLQVGAQAAEARLGHLRTRNGDHEVDFIVERADHRVLAVEVKLSPEVDDRDGIAVVPLGLLGA